MRFVVLDSKTTGLAPRHNKLISIAAVVVRGGGIRLDDTMDLTLHLEADGAFAGRPMAQGFSLDGLCDMFGILPHDRHTAAGDAFITAQVFQRLLRAAKRVGRNTVASLCEPYVAVEG